MQDARQRFSATADDYAKHRPQYPDALYDWIETTCGLADKRKTGHLPFVLDVACGTGISSRPLASRGYRVTGIDANEDMLVKARMVAAPVTYQRGDAEALGVAAACADLITAAQAFHWFDANRAIAEFRRALKPDGWVCIYWNLRATTPLNNAYDQILLTFSDEYRSHMKQLWRNTIAALAERRDIGDTCSFAHTHAQHLDWAAFLGRANSSSYVVHGVVDRAGFERELRQLFDQQQRDGAIEFAYDTKAFAFQPGPQQ